MIQLFEFTFVNLLGKVTFAAPETCAPPSCLPRVAGPPALAGLAAFGPRGTMAWVAVPAARVAPSSPRRARLGGRVVCLMLVW